MPANHCVPHTAEAKAKISAARRGKPNLKKRRPTKEVDGEVYYRCSACGNYHPYGSFYKNKRTILGITSECRQCHCARTIRTRDPEKTRLQRREQMRVARIKYPEKFRERERLAARRRPRNQKTVARDILNRAVRSGVMVRPESCSKCNAIGKITGHHPDYSKPLEVVWLCYVCHASV